MVIIEDEAEAEEVSEEIEEEAGTSMIIMREKIAVKKMEMIYSLEALISMQLRMI
jgi:hypothetical protein